MSPAPKKVSKFFPKYFENLGSLKGKTICITGTTSGTGFVAARVSFQKGARVIVVNRASPRVEASLKLMREELVSDSVSKEDFGEIETIDCDLQDLNSVRVAAAELNEKCADNGLDILCNNAGVMALDDAPTKDGFDGQMQINHLSHFLFTKLVFPSIQKAGDLNGEARIVNHTSAARSSPKTPLNAKYLGRNGGDLGGNGGVFGFGGARWERYHQSKLANSLFTLALKKKLESTQPNILSLCGDPGLAATGMQTTSSSQGGVSNLTGKLIQWVAQSQEDGALGILKCMFNRDVKSGELWGCGGFRGDPKPIEHGPFATREAEELLWQESENAVGEKFIL